MATGSRNDPYRAFNFRVEIDGIIQAGFQECGGLDVSTDSVDYREGTDPNHVRKLPGLNKISPITLKRGLTDSTELWDWRQSVVRGKTQRRNVSIVLLDESATEVVRWNIRDCWPSKWTGPALNSTGNAVAVEALELMHEELVRA